MAPYQSLSRVASWGASATATQAVLRDNGDGSSTFSCQGRSHRQPGEHSPRRRASIRIRSPKSILQRWNDWAKPELKHPLNPPKFIELTVNGRAVTASLTPVRQHDGAFSLQANIPTPRPHETLRIGPPGSDPTHLKHVSITRLGPGPSKILFSDIDYTLRQWPKNKIAFLWQGLKSKTKQIFTWVPGTQDVITAIREKGTHVAAVSSSPWVFQREITKGLQEAATNDAMVIPDLGVHLRSWGDNFLGNRVATKVEHMLWVLLNAPKKSEIAFWGDSKEADLEIYQQIARLIDGGPATSYTAALKLVKWVSSKQRITDENRVKIMTWAQAVAKQQLTTKAVIISCYDGAEKKLPKKIASKLTPQENNRFHFYPAGQVGSAQVMAKMAEIDFAEGTTRL